TEVQESIEIRGCVSIGRLRLLRQSLLDHDQMDAQNIRQLVEVLALQAQNINVRCNVHEWCSFRGMCASSNRGALITKAPGEEKSTLDTLGSFLIGGGRVGV